MSAETPAPPAGPAPAAPAALPDELLLLAMDDETGKLHGSSLDVGLVGAVLVDLALRRRISVEDGRVTVLDPAPTGDAVLDRVLATVAASSAERSAKHWVGTAQAGVRDAVVARLVAAGALQEDTRRVLGLFRVTRHPEGDPGPESRVRARLDDAVLRGVDPDERTAALASLVGVTGLRAVVFEGADRRATEARLKELAEGGWAPRAVRQAIQDVEMAMITAVMVSTTMTTTTSS